MNKINDYIARRANEGKSVFILKGGRRSGKTYGILTFLLWCCHIYERFIVNVASMTSEQGRLGAYADAKNIIADDPRFSLCEVLSSPREIRFRNGSRIFFNSYQNSETAKGIACDALFVNEANNFSLQQYTDLRANVRRFTFLDYNPNCLFWVDDLYEDADICHTTWKDNPFLTSAQLEYFADLKRMAERDNATSLDRRNYSVYYLGQYAEVDGVIFTRDNLRVVDALPPLRHMTVFCDPSALRGADWFAMVLSGIGEDGIVYVADAYSRNDGSREQMAWKIVAWCKAWDVERVYVETNGIIGIDFHEFCANSGLDVSGWCSRGNKFQRITARYQDITTRMAFFDTPEVRAFLEQCYDFGERCDHDDNIDAVASTWTAQQLNF